MKITEINLDLAETVKPLEQAGVPSLPYVEFITQQSADALRSQTSILSDQKPI